MLWREELVVAKPRGLLGEGEDALPGASCGVQVGGRRGSDERDGQEHGAVVDERGGEASVSKGGEKRKGEERRGKVGEGMN